MKKVLSGARERAGQSLLRNLSLRGVIGKDRLFLGAMKKIERIANTEVTVLLEGETGTGKEVGARTLHYWSKRASGPFVPVNCGAIPASLLENELFGHGRGAFTDARSSQDGLIAEAEGGTLFLDEIEALGPRAQTALLRLLETRTYRPLGKASVRKADVRILAATNAILKEKVADQQFRADLMYRLSISVRLPALRERKQDLPLLADHILAKFAREYGAGEKRLSPAATAKLTEYHWPGNIRELQNVLREAVLFASSEVIGPRDISLSGSCDGSELIALPLTETKRRVVQQFEKEYLTKLLTKHRGNVLRAARHAQKDRRDFRRLLQKHKIDSTHFRNAP